MTFGTPPIRRRTANESREDDDCDADPADVFRLPTTTDVPHVQLTGNEHPDLLFAWMQRYAEQVRMLDAVLDVLSLSLRDRDPRLMIAGTSGFSLGQNGWIGHHVGPLRSNDVRLPMITSVGGPLRVPTLRPATDFPRVLGSLVRNETVVTPSEWCRADEEHAPRVETQSERAVAAITTSRWYYVVDREMDSENLFLKPDDIDDVNDVSRLRRDVVAAF